MGRLRLLVVSVALVVAAPATAAAQGRATERSSQSLQVQGAIEVEFRGTPAAGCAAAATCDVAGTVSYVPGGRGRLFRTTFRRADGSLRRDASAFVFGFGSAGQAIGIARRGDEQCVDARTLSEGSLDVRIVADRLELGLGSPRRFFGFGGGDLLRTRCTGPRAAEVLAALGTRRVSLSGADAGRTVSFAATAAFSAGGLAGTVRSSVRVVLEPARRQTIRRRTGRRSTGRRRSAPRRVPTTRQVTFPLRLVRIEGDASVNFASDPASCRRLDACGITGTTTIAPRPSATPTFFSLSVRSRSRSAALATVGLGAGRAAPVAFGGGGASWSTDRGRVSTRLERDGVLSCAGPADAPGGGFVELRVDRASRRLNVRLLASGLGVSRCPGPLAGDLGEGDQGGAPVLASGSIPLTAVRRPRQTVTLTEGGTLGGPGYTGDVRSGLRVVLERGQVRLGG